MPDTSKPACSDISLTEPEKRKRMVHAVKSITEFSQTYNNQNGFHDFSDTIFIDDFLYGIGVSLEPKKFYGADGYQKFKKFLLEYLAKS